jgi:glycine/D-amino acid oxidase-like deaminating enzyme
MMAIWTYDTAVVEPRYPVEPFLNPKYPEICVRGLTKLFPQIKSYLSDSEVRKSFRVNGGYYCKTLDNMPLIGPAPSTIDGVFMLSAMSGIGLM